MERPPQLDLIRAIREEFARRFLPLTQTAYDRGVGMVDEKLLSSVGVEPHEHDNMPDLVLYCSEKNWLLLAQAATSSGPIGTERHQALSRTFSASRAELVFLSAMADRETFRRHADSISWQTHVWIASDPDHLIHFNGARFLGPYPHQS